MANNKRPNHGGATWVRACLQVNPFEYKGTNQPSTKFSDEDSYNEALLVEMVTLGISMFAVTDHWCINSAQGLIAAAKRHSITGLPGFEGISSEGVHVLVIFEEDTKQEVINAAIGACGVTPNCPSGTTGESFQELVREMTDRGALVIPAHANVERSGLLTGRTGKPLEKMVKHEDLHAICISPGVATAAAQADVFNGRKPFERKYPLAEIYADDVNHPDTLKKSGSSTWFKISERRLSGIKHAVRIPMTRIATVNPSETARVLLKEISWTGGFLDGVSLPLAEDLTALIGGRGTGKSSVIESLRYVLGIRPIGEVSKKDHSSIVKNVLQTGTVIELKVDAVSPSRSQYLIQRTVPDPAIVFDQSGTRTTLKPIDIVGQMEIFGQHELAEVAQLPTSVAQLIEGVAAVPSVSLDSTELLSRLRENREMLHKAEEALSNLEEELSDRERLDDAIAQYTASDLPAKLKEQERLEKDAAVITEAQQRLTAARRAVNRLVDSEIVENLNLEFGDIAESNYMAELGKVPIISQRTSAKIASAISLLRDALDEGISEIESVLTSWNKLSEPARDGHAEVVRNLKSDGHDPDKYLATARALESLKAKAPRVGALRRQIKQLKTSRTELLGELETAVSQRRKRLTQAIRIANKATSGSVIVRPIPSPDRTALTACANKHVQNSRAKLLETISSEDFSPKDFVAKAREGGNALKKSFGITGAQTVAIGVAGEDFLREFEELSVDLAVDVSLDVSPEGTKRDYRNLAELSKGQRATALLLLLLGTTDSPLIIDQPEDDLDNRFIYDHIVKRLREIKGTRQVIVSTHNANVPVLGDAELVVVLEGNGQNGWPMEGGIGSLDSKRVREIAEHILEGGREAFDARMHLYGV